MDETDADLRHLLTKLEAQVSRQCATIGRLQRDLKQLQEDNRRLVERLRAREVLDALAPDVDVASEPLPDVPTTLGAWTEWIEGLFASTRRHN